MSDKVIPLSGAGYELHGVAFRAVTLRAPRGADYWALGPVTEVQPAGDGQAIVTYHDRVAAYGERLLTAPGPGALAMLDLADTLRVEEAILDFFGDARRSIRQPTSSSGTPARPSATSVP